MLRCNSLSIFMPAPKDPVKKAAFIAKIKAWQATHKQPPEVLERAAKKRAKTNMEKYGHVGANGSPEVNARFRKSVKATYARRGDEIRKHRESVSMEKYGVRHWLQNDKIMDKQRATNLERYGVANQFEDVGKIRSAMFAKHGVYNASSLKSVRDKRAQTNMLKYGYVAPAQNSVVEQKMFESQAEKYGSWFLSLPDARDAFKEKYGVDNPMYVDRFKDMMVNTAAVEKYGKDDADTAGRGLGQGKRVVVNRCKELYDRGMNYSQISHVIDIPNPTVQKAFKENGFEGNFSKTTLPEQLALDLLKSAIPDHEIIQHDRSVLGHLELDLYVPDLKLAMEVNGIYWHSDKFKDRSYHMDKFNACSKKGVRLIQAWDYELDDLRKVDILKSILRCAAGTSDPIGARETELIRIDGASPRVDTFLDANHWEGRVPVDDQCVSYALCSHNNIVQMMTLRPQDESTWEILRSCSKLGVSVTGGTSRLVNAFQSYVGHGKLVSYSDNQLFSGHSYRASGFVATGCEVGYDWWHVNTDEFVCQRAAGHDPRQILGESFNPNLSEIANMHNAGWLRIWDAGRTRWELTF